jgi:uncharacterized protein (DUF1697 family)
MNTYIALLRGINVSGQKKIKMDELQDIFEDLNFSVVETYIQSGNVAFQSENTDQYDLARLVKDEINEKYGFNVEVIVLSQDEIQNVLDRNPFIDDPTKDPERFYVTFLSEKPSTDKIENLKTYDYNPEEYHLINTTIYFYAANGYGRAKMNNNFFENKLKVFATTRNWKTVNKLVEICKK